MSEVTTIVHLNNIELFFKYSISLFYFNALAIEHCSLNIEAINFFFDDCNLIRYAEQQNNVILECTSYVLLINFLFLIFPVLDKIALCYSN